jgi:CRP/FNR family transcriptional regulator, dissimilatory nitrate respiration regulator
MKEENAFGFFRSLALCRNLPDETVRALTEAARMEFHEAGRMIHGRGEPAQSFHVLAQGRAKLFRLLPDGKEQTIFLYEPGEPFCLCTAFEDDGYPAGIAALERSAVYSIPSDAFQRIAYSAPELLLNIALMLSRRLKEAMERIETLSTRDGGRRLALFLLRLARNEEDRVNLPMTHRELAKILGVTPEALSRTLHRLSDSGLIAVEGRIVLLRDRRGLETILAGGVDID